MVNRKNTQYLLPAYLFIALSLVAAVIIFYLVPVKWAEYSFSNKSTPLRYEGFIWASLAWALSLVLLYKLTKLRGFIFATSWMFAIFIMVSSWLNFDFYKDFLTFDAVYMVKDMVNSKGSAGFSSLPSYVYSLKALSISALLVLLVLLVRAYSKEISKRALLFLLVVPLMIVLIYAYKYIQIDKEKRESFTPPLYVHPVTFFLFASGVPEELSDEIRIAASFLNAESESTTYPLQRNRKVVESIEQKELLNKNVIILVLESFRGAEVGYLNPDKPSITPNMDRIAKQSLYFDQFYANSHQTIRGEVAILCSVFDFSRGSPISSRHIELDTICLPEILKKQGYKTLWFHGNEKSFFAREQFLPKIGFDQIYDEAAIKEQYPNVAELGWGVADVDMMESTFDVLSKQDGPFVAEIVSLSNHFPFNWDFPPVNNESDQNEEVYNHFLRGINYTDKALGVFWDLFQQSSLKDNTLLVVVADHGLWMSSAEDDESDLELMHENQFKIPMAIWGKGIKPELNSKLASQVDITPTVLDMLNLRIDKDAFLGESIFKVDRRDLVLATGFNNFVSLDNESFCFPNVGSEIKKGYYRDRDGTKAIKNRDLVCVPRKVHKIKEKISTKLESKVELYRNIIKLNDYSLLNGFMDE